MSRSVAGWVSLGLFWRVTSARAERTQIEIHRPLSPEQRYTLAACLN